MCPAGTPDATDLFADVWQQGHETGSLDRCGHSVLAGCGATAFATTDDPALAIDHLLQQLDVLVIDVHRPWAVPIDEDRVFLAGTATDS